MLKLLVVIIYVSLIRVEAQNIYVVRPGSYFNEFFYGQIEFFKEKSSVERVLYKSF